MTDDKTPPARPAKRLTTKRFRVDLVQRLTELANRTRPRASVTAHMDLAFELYLEAHEPRQEGRRRQAGKGERGA